MADTSRIHGIPSWRSPVVHGGLIAAALLVFVLWIGANSYVAFSLLLIATYAIAAMGLNIPAGYGGALSLGQGGAVAVGAYTAAIVATRLEWPVWLALIAAFGVAYIFGFIMGLPAARLGVIGLAMITLGFTLIVSDLALELSSLTGGFAGISNIRPMLWFGSQGAMSSTVLAVVVLALTYAVYVGHWAYRESRRGRQTIAVRDDRIGAEGIGIPVARVQARAFALGTAIGGVAGGLYVYVLRVVTPASADEWLSVALLAMVILGGSGSRIGPLIGAAVLAAAPFYLSRYPLVSEFLYGAILIAVVRFMPRGVVPGRPGKVPDQLRIWRHLQEAEPLPAETTALASTTIVVDELTKEFDGNRALDRVSLRIEPGQIVGVVGPNGSGKTTLLNVMSGFYEPTRGSVTIGEHRIAPGQRLKPHQIAGLGIARTFQTPKTFPALSVEEHLTLGLELGGTSEGDPDELTTLAVQLIEAGGISLSNEGAGRAAGTLSHGQLRFLEMAMVLMRRPTVVLLDEPAAGLAAAEIEVLERTIRRLGALGIAVVLVEHHIDVVRRLADQIAVLHVGRLLWMGPPDRLEESTEVRDAYLGTTV